MSEQARELQPLPLPPLVAQANAAHARCMALDEDVRDVILDKVNAIRECGLILASIKTGRKHGEWLGLFDPENETRFAFGARTAQTYMRFAEALPREVTSLPDGIRSITAFMRATGALPPADPNDGEARNTNPFSALMDGVKAIRHTFTGWGDVKTWPQNRREQAREQLRPLVEFYEELSALEAREV